MADLSIEQLEELLQKKRSTPQTAPPPVPKCSFKSTRSPFNACDKPSVTFYGEFGYCQEHTRSVQARKAKQLLEEKKTPLPPPAPEPVIPEPTPPSPKEAKRDEVKEVEHAKVKEEPVPEEEVNLKRPSVVKKSIRRNQWGNFEDPDTNIVFNAKTKAAWGVQDHKSGMVTALKEKHIALCKKYGWRYNLIKEESESSSEEESDESDDEPEPEEGSDDEPEPEEEEIEESDEEDGEEDIEEDVDEEGENESEDNE